MDDLKEKARALRRSVLGDAYVNQSAGGGDPLIAPKTQMSEYVWANIWGRPGLPHKMRSVINLALLTAINHPHELKLHVSGALNNGLTPEEIMEVFLQCGTYCGIQAAKDSFEVMREVFKERGIS